MKINKGAPRPTIATFANFLNVSPKFTIESFVIDSPYGDAFIYQYTTKMPKKSIN